MRSFYAVITLFVLAGPGLAEECPAAPDHSVAFARLVEAIRAAPDQRAALRISNEMWALWTDAPDERAQAMLDRGMTRRAASDLTGALADFDALIAYCPGYAEGYNQRAFANFIAGDYEKALVDLDRALDITPTHLGALSGRAMTHIALGREEDARRDLAVATDLNPWLPERHLLPPEALGKGDADL